MQDVSCSPFDEPRALGRNMSGVRVLILLAVVACSFATEAWGETTSRLIQDRTRGAWTTYLLDNEVLLSGTLSLGSSDDVSTATLQLGAGPVTPARTLTWNDNVLEAQFPQRKGTLTIEVRFGEDTARGRWARASQRGKLWLGRGDTGIATTLRIARGTQQRTIRAKYLPADNAAADFRRHAVVVVPRDHYPVLFDPRFATRNEAPQIKDDEPVLGLLIGGEAKAYPISVLGRHELVNDTCGGLPIAASW